MNKYLKYTLKGFGFLILFLIVAYTVVYIYVVANKKSIITKVTTQISEKLNGDVSIGNVDLSFFSTFPTMAVVLEKVSIKDSMYAQHKHTFLEADKVFIKLSVLRLIKRQSPLSGLKLTGGNVYLYTDTSGYTNTYLFKQKKDPKKAAPTKNETNELKDIELQDVRIVIEDKKREKLHDLMVTKLKTSISETPSHYILDIDNDILVNSLAFNLPRGSFVKGKRVQGDYELRYDKALQQLQFDSVNMKIGGQPFSFAGGKFDFTGPAPQFSIRIHTKGVLFAEAKALVTPRIAKALSIVNLDKPVSADVIMTGPLRGGDPLIHVFWEVKNSQLSTPFLQFEDASLTGSYTDEVVPGLPRRDPNSKIIINNFTATWQGLPITSNNFTITNLFAPILECDLKSDFPLTKLGQSMNSNTMQFESGQGVINITYKGPILRNNNTNSFVNGFITITNGAVKYVPRDVTLNNVAGKILFKNSDVFVENLQCVVLNNKIVMQGFAKQLLSLIGTKASQVQIDWNIYSPSLNLAAFSYLLQPQKKTVVRKKASTNLENTAQQIDDAIEQGSIKVKLKADKLYYKKFEGSNAVADISLLQDRYILHKVSLQHAGGTMDLSGSLVNSSANYHNTQVNVSMANMDVSKVLAAFNNFGQDGITAENLRGKLTADASVNAALNDEGQVYKESVQGTVDFSLKNGALVNYEPIKKMQVLIFKNRDFDNITFAELKDKLEIKNQEVKINRMEIQSSVLGMFVEGVFSMKGTTDMRIQVPLSNLKKRGADYVPENLADGKKAGSSIFLRGTPGKDGNIKFKVDLFNKLRKEKDAVE